MSWKPLNKTLFVIPEGMEASVDNPEIARILNDKNSKIILPEHNTVMKVNPEAKVYKAANDCVINYLKNQLIRVYELDKTPVEWLMVDGIKCRVIKEWDIAYYDEY